MAQPFSFECYCFPLPPAALLLLHTFCSGHSWETMEECTMVLHSAFWTREALNKGLAIISHDCVHVFAYGAIAVEPDIRYFHVLFGLYRNELLPLHWPSSVSVHKRSTSCSFDALWEQQAGVTSNNRMTGFSTSAPHWLPLTPQLHIKPHPEQQETRTPVCLLVCRKMCIWV